MVYSESPVGIYHYDSRALPRPWWSVIELISRSILIIIPVPGGV